MTTDKYYQTIGSASPLKNDYNVYYYPSISQLSNESYAICYNKLSSCKNIYQKKNNFFSWLLLY